MRQYANKNGNSGVKDYELFDQSIIVTFNDNSSYEYTHRSAGRASIEQMKVLALSGSGLNSYINMYVKNNYSRKLS